MADAGEEHAFPNTLIYFSPSSVNDVADFTRQELKAQGWLEYTLPNSVTADDSNAQTLTFIQNGLALSAFIVVAPAQGNKHQCNIPSPSWAMDLPIHAGAMNLEYDQI